LGVRAHTCMKGTKREEKKTNRRTCRVVKTSQIQTVPKSDVRQKNTEKAASSK